MYRPCTEQFLVYVFLGAVCELLSNSSPTEDTTGRVELDMRIHNPAQSHISALGSTVGLVTVDAEFVVVSMTAPTTPALFTPALRRTLGVDAEDRRVVEMSSTPNEVCYRLHRSLFTQLITVHTKD